MYIQPHMSHLLQANHIQLHTIIHIQLLIAVIPRLQQYMDHQAMEHQAMDHLHMEHLQKHHILHLHMALLKLHLMVHREPMLLQAV